MPSSAYNRWTSERKAALDELARTHRLASGSRPRRRYATQQVKEAYVVLLCSQFQGFCRELHSECIDSLTPASLPRPWRAVVQSSLKLNRKLDTGNPNPGNIGSDFKRFDVAMWDEVRSLDPRNQNHRDSLDELMKRRNAIVHQDFDPLLPGSAALRLRQIRGWQQSCDVLAIAFDGILADHIRAVTGQGPW